MKRPVTRVDRSPMNRKRWVLKLSCGHEVWITSTSKPTRKEADCHECSRRNASGVKDSCDQYRNIGGVRFECWTADSAEFYRERKEAKALGLRTRMIDGQLYREVPPS